MNSFILLLLNILIILHSSLCYISTPSLPSLNYLNFDFELNLDFFLSNLKSSIPDYIKDIQKSMEEFLKKTEKEKDEYIASLSSKVGETYNKIKIGMNKGSNNVQSDIKILIEKTTETAKALSYKACDILQEEYEQCINNKKKIFSNLLQIIENNFGKCSIIVNEILNLSDNIELNLKYFLFLIISLTENPDSIQKGKTQIIYDIINCLQEKLNYLWPSINSKLTKKDNAINIKQDIISLLAKSISNCITFIQFEEYYGLIEKAENVTGLIKNAKAKQVYKNIFEIIKNFNEFGTQSYNISANLNINVFKNDNRVNPNSQKSIYYKDKGIRINLHLDYMLKDLKAYSVQAVVFESPLVSLRVKRKTKEGTANTFVGITLYDKEGNEIYISDIKLENLRPVILFKKKLFKAMKTCLYYNEEKDMMESEGIETQFVEFEGEEYIKCIPKHLSSFTIGSFDDEEIYKEKNGGKNEVIFFIIKVCLVVIILGIGFYFYRWFRRKRIETINNQYNQ